MANASDVLAEITLERVGAVLAALGALATAAFGLLDAFKVAGGGASNIGLGAIYAALAPFDGPLTLAIGKANYRATVRANWINGMTKADQKAVVRALIKLGLSPATAPDLAAAAHVDPAALQLAAKKLETGKPLTDADLNVLGRMSAVVDALLDTGFERAEQQFKNASRALAGALAVLLAWLATFLWPEPQRPHFWLAFAVGLLAVPLAPVAKDLTSALSTAMRAIKAAKTL